MGLTKYSHMPAASCKWARVATVWRVRSSAAEKARLPSQPRHARNTAYTMPATTAQRNNECTNNKTVYIWVGLKKITDGCGVLHYRQAMAKMPLCAYPTAANIRTEGGQ